MTYHVIDEGRREFLDEMNNLIKQTDFRLARENKKFVADLCLLLSWEDIAVFDENTVQNENFKDLSVS